MDGLAEPAYAKINLTLDITGRREDGYHTLRSVLQSISLCDRVFLFSAESGTVTVECDAADVPCGAENTVLRAAGAFFRRSGVCGGARFKIQKRIPRRAGLGGGSTDAAAALRLLNRFFGARLSARELRKIGLEAGADVPFCVEGGAALAEGVGELLRPLPGLPPCALVICKPEAGVPTAEAYAAFDRSGRPGDVFTGAMLQALRAGALSAVASRLGNAFESVCGLPEVRGVRDRLLACGALGACMTGSGSAVFGLFDSECRASRCANALRAEYPVCFLCRPVGRICV